MQNCRRRVLVFGDSNSWGWIPNDEDGPCRRYPDGVRATCIMADRLGPDYEVLVDALINRTTNIPLDAPWGGLEGCEFSGAATIMGAIARSMPLDAIVIGLGGNDLQTAFDRAPGEIADAVAGLVETSRNAARYVNTAYPAPKILVLVPPPIHPRGGSRLARLFRGATEKSAGLGPAFASKLATVPRVDGSLVIPEPQSGDGIHLTPDEHRRIGVALAHGVRGLFPVPNDSIDFTEGLAG